MKNLRNFKKMHIFFVGIGGISMSGLAKMSLLLGARVSGSDIHNNYLPELSGMGGVIYLGHDEVHINKDIDLVVFTGAIPKDNVELVKARELGIEIMERDEFLGVISTNFKNVIAISGCHGKTTVTSMIGHIFKCAHLNPTIHIGGESLNLKSNTILGGNNYFILEACEYRESFLKVKPTLGVILNIDKDHIDYYKSLENINKAFQKFADNSKTLVTNNDEIIHSNKYIVNNFWQAQKIKVTKFGYKYKVYYKNKYYMTITLPIMGRHNISNSLFAIDVTTRYKIHKKYIKKAFSTYKGVKRRYEIIGEYYSVPVLADYAHHPNEISSSIKGIEERYNNPLIIFQPHTYSRTISLINEFIDTLSKYKSVIIHSTYPAREKYNPKGSAYTLFKKIKSEKKFYSKDIKSLNAILHNIMLNNTFDVVVILGAGDLYDKIKEIIIEKV